MTERIIREEGGGLTVIGLTGGSGAGKGYVSQSFETLGIHSLDTDKVSRAVCLPGMPCLREIADSFGGSVILPDGTLDRRGLGAIVFADEEKRLLLNSITHKHILAECRRWLGERAAAGDAAAIIDAPLLFESGFNVWCDWTVAVIADREVRIGRIMARDGISRESAANRIYCQPPEKFYIKRCDYIIYNNGTERADLQADLIWQMIRWV